MEYCVVGLVEKWHYEYRVEELFLAHQIEVLFLDDFGVEPH